MDAQPRVQRLDLPLLLSRALRPAAPLLALALAAGPAAGQRPAPEAGARDSVLPGLGAADVDTLVATAGPAELAARLDGLLSDPALARAHVGLKVTVAESGEVLYERAAEKRFTAASTVKLVTASAALERLGPGYRWSTRLVADGPVEDGVLHGDLWVVGGGDPGLDRDDLARWASRLRRAGVRRIAGDVVGDGRALPPPRWGRGWMWDELHLGWAAGVTGLQLDEGGVRVWVVPGREVGAPALARPEDPDRGAPLRLEIDTGSPGSTTRLAYRPGDDGPGSGRIEGWVPADADSVPLWMAPSHPTDQLLDALGSVLRDSSVAVGGDLRRPRDEEAPPPAAPPGTAGRPGERVAGLDHVFPSDSLGAVLADMLAPSDNQTAEILLRTLGREAGRGPTAREGLAEVGEALAEWGIDPASVDLADGSGLSRYDELTPAALVRLLRRMWRSPHHRTLASALAAPGEEGTLESRLLATPAREGLRAKTGSLSSVRGLAGYVEAGDGRTLVFALLVNGYGAPGAVVEGLRDLLVEQLSLHRRAVAPGWPGIRQQHRDGGGGGGR